MSETEAEKDEKDAMISSEIFKCAVEMTSKKTGESSKSIIISHFLSCGCTLLDQMGKHQYDLLQEMIEHTVKRKQKRESKD
jgi:hypothetical protein